ncbi:MAG TPA: PIG-L family deacetylase [Steroidobacteraceae bacterium]|nr:PIG-L family deacetylase [Steroidobacteraceae bacterium]
MVRPRAAPQPPRSVPASPSFPVVGAGTHLLVVAPHPDDETLCCAGAIQRVMKAGGRVSILWVTSGDGSELDLLVVEKSMFLEPRKLQDLAEKRMQEARTAAGILGVSPEHLIFLGYPDRGILPLMTDNYITPYYSRFTATSHVPYADAAYPGHPYAGASLEKDFNTALDRLRPNVVLAPSPRDSHPDHRATGILAMRVLSARNELSSLRYWIVHGGDGWPDPPRYEPDAPLTPPPRGKGLDFQTLPLEAADEQRKAAALRAYRTQMEVMGSFLLSFVRTTELYASIPVPPARRP